MIFFAEFFKKTNPRFDFSIIFSKIALANAVQILFSPLKKQVRKRPWGQTLAKGHTLLCLLNPNPTVWLNFAGNIPDPNGQQQLKQA
jgi:hypothetical protein